MLLATEPQLTLLEVALDDFGEPEIVDTFDLPGAPRDLAAIPRRAVVLISGDLVVANLDTGEVRALGLGLPNDADRLATDAAQGLAFVAGGADGALQVVDLGAEAVIRSVDLFADERVRGGEVTDMTVARGRLHALLAETPDDDGRAASFLLTIEPEG